MTSIAHSAAELRGLLKPSKTRQALSVNSFVFIAVCIFMAIGAVNGENNLLIWLFGASSALLVLSGLLSGIGLTGIRVAVFTPETCVAGEPFEIRVHVANESRWPVFGLQFLVDKTEGLRLSQPALLFLGGRSGSSVTFRAVADHRGEVGLEGLRVRCSFPLGVAVKSLAFKTERRIVSWPARVEVRDLDRLLQNRGDGSGQVSGRVLGQGQEFFGLREYVEGDRLRDVAWTRSGLGQGYLVRQYAQPTTRRIWIELDLAGKLEAPDGGTTWKQLLESSPVERALAAASRCCAACFERDTPFGLVIRGGGVLVAAGSGGRHLRQAQSELARLGDSGTAAARGWGSGQRDTVIRIADRSVNTAGAKVDASDPDQVWVDANPGSV